VRNRKEEERWSAGALLFSGRPDPIWPLDESVALPLVRLFDALSPSTAAKAAVTGLGYRGCFLRDSLGHEWRAFRGIVESDRGGGREVRSDEKRAFEKAILATAPSGTLPVHLID
jgi:hypothetical protein